MTVKINNIEGYTVGLRSNGDRCILWDDETKGDGGFEWFNAEDFTLKFGA